MRARYTSWRCCCFFVQIGVWGTGLVDTALHQGFRFEVGDFIVTGDHMGTVERVGIKTTRVCSLEGEQIIFPNSNLLNSRIRNFKRMTERRLVFKFRRALHDIYRGA